MVSRVRCGTPTCLIVSIPVLCLLLYFNVTSLSDPSFPVISSHIMLMKDRVGIQGPVVLFKCSEIPTFTVSFRISFFVLSVT